MLGLKDGKRGTDRAKAGRWKTGTIVPRFGFEGGSFLWRDGKLGDNELDGCLRLCPLTSVDDYSSCRSTPSYDWAYCSLKNPERFSHKLIVNLLRLVPALLQKIKSTATKKFR